MRHVVVGLSRLTEQAIRTLRRLDPYGVIVFIERDAEAVTTLSTKLGVKGVVGDLLDPATYARAEVDKADVFVAVTGDSSLNVRLASMAAEVYGVPRCLALVDDPTPVENLPLSVRSVSMARYLELELSAAAAFDRWFEVPLVPGLRLRALAMRFARSGTDLSLRALKEEAEMYGVAAFFFSPEGALIANLDKRPTSGDYMVILGGDEVERAAKAVEKLISKHVVRSLEKGLERGFSKGIG